jgi:hypothetical protein
MSINTNPDRIYVTRADRAMIHFDREEASSSGSGAFDVHLPSMGAALMDISMGGCCLRLPGFEVPAGFRPEHHISSIKLLHPELDNSPIKGRIVWSREKRLDVLIGVQFTKVEAATMDSIQAFVKQRLPPRE